MFESVENKKKKQIPTHFLLFGKKIKGGKNSSYGPTFPTSSF
jgi:hypothetical protein